MFIVHVQVQVHPKDIEAFKAATALNARESLKESGVARFDVVQRLDDPAHFVLVEVYRTPEDPARHKQTAHYAIWAETVAPMMAEPRTSQKFQPIFPDEGGW
jgi:quinol monooxygenase YgiN